MADRELASDVAVGTGTVHHGSDGRTPATSPVPDTLGHPANQLEALTAPDSALSDAARAALMSAAQSTIGTARINRLMNPPLGPGRRAPSAQPAETLPVGAVEAAHARSAGEPLATSVRGPIERVLGADLADVRVHAGPEASAAAESLSARAFASGNGIFLGPGESATDTRLMAHEAAHVVQNRRAPEVRAYTGTGGDGREVHAQRAEEAAVHETARGRAAWEPVLTLTPEMQRRMGLQLPEAPIEGPLPPGTTLESHGLTVRQIDALHVEIEYGEAWVRLAADPEDTYAFSIGPPIEGPPKPKPQFELVGIEDPDAPKPELPQRLVRVIATRPIDQERVAEDARVPPLAVQTRFASAKEIAERAPGVMDRLEVSELADDDHAQLQLENSMIQIDVASNAAQVAGEAKRARFAYWIDPEWTGAQATEKRVVIVAAPGVTVRTGSPAYAPVAFYGRKLVAEVIRVPHPGLVPEQGTRLSVEQFVSVNVVDPDAPETPFAKISGIPGVDDRPHRREVDVTTGLAGVVVTHPSSGARLSLKPSDPSVGGAYAWEVLPPVDGSPGEIRAVVGPGVEVELQEPVPYRLRDHHGHPTPTPKKGEAATGEGLREESIELNLVELADPALVPEQGTPLNIEHFLAVGGRFREPDHHVWLGTDDLSYQLASAGMDMIFSSIPIVGTLYMIGEFAYAMATDHDFWGNEVDASGKVMMGIGAVLSLIPLVGGLGALLRGSAKTAVVAELAARWGTTTKELQVVLVRVGAAVEGDEAAIVQKAMRAIEKGQNLAEEDLPALQRVLGKVGAGRLGIEGIARSGIGGLDLALAAGGEPLRSEHYLANLMSAYRTSGEIPEELARPLARSAHFGNAEEAEAAIQQALRDLARAERVAPDEAAITAVAQKTARAMTEVQVPMVKEVAQSRKLAVSQPALFAKYEELMNQKLPSVVGDVLKSQRVTPTPTRTKLAQLRLQLNQLRQQVGNAERLTDAQRDLANKILRDARKAAGADFNNVRDGIWRRIRRDPDLMKIEKELAAAGDIDPTRKGGPLYVRMETATKDTRFDPLNIEHRIRRSDNPWLYNDPKNLIVADAPQNQQYLESLRREASIWPTDAVEDFIIRHGLNDQGIEFQPRSR